MGCPQLVPTTYVSSTELTAEIPDLAGPDGTTLAIGVYVLGADGASEVVPFTVQWPRVRQQAWTTVEAVKGEVRGFQSGNSIRDEKIAEWIRSAATTIAAMMLKRGLSLDPADWAQASELTAMPAPSEALEKINRLGAAASLASRIAGGFAGGESGLAKHLEAEFARELKMLEGGGYDNLFRPSAAIEETGALFRGGDMTDERGCTQRAFTKGQVF